MNVLNKIKTYFTSKKTSHLVQTFPDLLSVGDVFSVNNFNERILIEFSMLIWDEGCQPIFTVVNIGQYTAFGVETRHYYFRNQNHTGYLQVTYPFGYRGEPDVAIFFDIISDNISDSKMMELIGNQFVSGSLLNPILDIKKLPPLMDQNIIFNKAIDDFININEQKDGKASKYKILLFDREITNLFTEMLIISVQKQKIALEIGYLIKFKDLTF